MRASGGRDKPVHRKVINLEITNPDLVNRLNAQIWTGRFHNADELLERALDAFMIAAKYRRAAKPAPSYLPPWNPDLALI